MLHFNPSARAPEDASPLRLFSTKWFAKAAEKAGLTRADLCKAGRELAKGQGHDLGGGVWKKRLLGNRLRSIVVVQGPTGWVFTYLFAKADRSNISLKELAMFKQLADVHGGFSASDIQRALNEGALIEVRCD